MLYLAKYGVKSLCFKSNNRRCRGSLFACKRPKVELAETMNFQQSTSIAHKRLSVLSIELNRRLTKKHELDESFISANRIVKRLFGWKKKVEKKV